jgi:hypothetical protein
MNCNVLFEVNFLGEASVTALFLASKGFFASMDAEVVNEVMPLAEVEIAVGVIAFENSYHSISLGILKFVDPILFRHG